MILRAGKFLLTLRNLEHINRYQTRKMLFPRSVAEHTTGVFYAGYVLGQWEERKFGNKIDWEKLSMKLMFHDVPESITGDILSPTKNYTKNMKEAIKETEKLIFEEKFIPIIPKSWRGELKEYMLHGKDDSIEGMILKASDLIDGIFEIRNELMYTNEKYDDEFRTIIQRYLLKLSDINLESVKYFLKYPLQDLEIENYFPEGFKEKIDSYYFDKKHFENELSIKKEGLWHHILKH